jgi:hypothetical protein
VKRLLPALGFAAGLLARWEIWVLWLLPFAIRGVLRAIQDTGIGVDALTAFPLIGHVSVWDLLWAMKYAALLGATVVILAAIVEGGRGLCLAQLRRHLSAALLAAAVAFGIVSGFSVVADRIRFSGAGGATGEAVVLALDAAQFMTGVLAAWVGFARMERDDGRKPPGLGVVLGAGLVCGGAGQILPWYVVTYLIPRDPFGAASLPENLALDYGFGLLEVLTVAWYLRTMVLAREAAPAAEA